MSERFNILVTSLLACLLFNFIFAAEINTVYRYRLSSSKSLRLEPSLNKTFITITADAFLRLINNTAGTTYSIILQNVDVAVQRENGLKIDYPECPSSKSAITALSQPFLAVYGEDGVLDYVRVNKSEPVLSMNFKLYGASLLQICPHQITGEIPPVEERLERFYPGLCPVTSVFSLDAGGNFGFVKSADLTQCIEVVNDHYSDSLTCLKNTCRQPGPGLTNKNFQWTAASNLLAKTMDNTTVIQTIVLSQQASYRPFVNSSLLIVVESITGTELISVDEFKNIPSFVDKDSVDISTPQYRPVSNSICNQTLDGDTDGLGEIYSALVCQQSFAVMYEDLIERAIICDLDSVF